MLHQHWREVTGSRALYDINTGGKFLGAGLYATSTPEGSDWEQCFIRQQHWREISGSRALCYINT